MRSSLDPSSEEHGRSRRNSVPAHQQPDHRGMNFHSLEATTVQQKKITHIKGPETAAPVKIQSHGGNKKKSCGEGKNRGQISRGFIRFSAPVTRRIHVCRRGIILSLGPDQTRLDEWSRSTGCLLQCYPPNFPGLFESHFLHRPGTWVWVWAWDAR